MALPGVDKVGERPLDEMIQSASQQAVVLAREQIDVARRELTVRARQASRGAAMVGGGALLGALASGTGTAGLVLLLARRRRESAAALGVTGAYVGAGALLAREGLARLRQAAPSVPEVSEEPKSGQNAKARRGSAKPRASAAAESGRRTTSTAKSAAKATPKAGRRTTSAVKSAAKATPRPAARRKATSKSTRSRRPASGPQTDRTRRRAS